MIQFSEQHKLSIDKIKWLQYIFLKQWKELKSYANNLSIQLFGDMPFYVSHDSAGTHDNNTIAGWYKQEINKADQERMHQYFDIKAKKKKIHELLARAAYTSVANTVILPMQDILGLDEDARMNTPGATTGNWLWRLIPEGINNATAVILCEWVKLYDRY